MNISDWGQGYNAFGTDIINKTYHRSAQTKWMFLKAITLRSISYYWPTSGWRNIRYRANIQISATTPQLGYGKFRSGRIGNK